MIKRTRIVSFYILSALFIISCADAEKKNAKRTNDAEAKYHAQKFKLTQKEKFTVLSIYDPWQNADSYLFEYYLSDTLSNIPDPEKNKKHFIQIPVKRVVCLSTTHIGYLDALNEVESIVGLANGNLVNNKQVIESLENNTIIDIGNDRNLNYEVLVDLKPDLIFAYGVGIESLEYKEKLDELGIKVMLIAEYLETHPLAKTEWIRAFAALYNKNDQADAIMQQIQTDYQKNKALVGEVKQKPRVLTGLPWKGTWYVPGGNSYLAGLIADAGGNYLWKEEKSDESIPMDFEMVFIKAPQTDIWINPGAADNKTDMISVDERISEFPVFKQGKIYNNNAVQNKLGGNDYWESGIMEPDSILLDLIHIFHHDILPDHRLKYYKAIN